MIESSNIFYVSNFNSIGGVETYIYELVRKYKDYDITVIYKTGDKKQIERIKKYVRIIQYKDQKIKCKRAFFNYETDIIDNIEAEEYIQLIHAMFKTQKIQPRICDKITKYFCVSKSAGEEWEELTGIKCKQVRNPLQIIEEEKKPVLYLISGTRLTPEKGKDRIIKLANLLDEADINYLWIIFTNDTNVIDNPSIIYARPNLNIRPILASIKGKGYGVQLSDCEGDCYFTRECEALGIPLLVTPIPSFKEQGLVDGKNCYYLPFNMENIDINKIVNKIPEYEGYIKPDGWDKEIIKDKSNYQDYLNTKAECICIADPNYYDLELKQYFKLNDELPLINIERAEYLENLGLIKIKKIIKKGKKKK